MSYDYKKTNKKETKKQKFMRIFIAVLYFFEVVLTTSPFVWGMDDKGNPQQLTAFQIAVQPNGYDGVQDIKLAIVFGLILLLPLVGFFFCILDKSRVKNFFNLACGLVCVCIITFGIGPDMGSGAFWSMLIYVFVLFLNTINLLDSVKKSS